MGSREQLNNVRSNRWGLQSPCQAPKLFSQCFLSNLLQKGKSNNHNHTDVWFTRSAAGGTAPLPPQRPRAPLAGEMTPGQQEWC